MPTMRKRVQLSVFDSEGCILERDLPDVLMPRDLDGCIKLQPLLDSLKKHYNLAASESSHLVSLFNTEYDCFCLAGPYGNLKQPALSDEETGPTLQLKLRICLEQVVPSADDTPSYLQTAKPKGERVKERKIGDVVAKVLQWRKIYGDGTKISLEQAASKVGMSKKSLDDYLLQLK